MVGFFFWGGGCLWEGKTKGTPQIGAERRRPGSAARPCAPPALPRSTTGGRRTCFPSSFKTFHPPSLPPLLLKNNPPPLQPSFLMLLASLRGCRQAPPAGRQETCTRMVLVWVFFFFKSSPGYPHLFPSGGATPGLAALHKLLIWDVRSPHPLLEMSCVVQALLVLGK